MADKMVTQWSFKVLSCFQNLVSCWILMVSLVETSS